MKRSVLLAAAFIAAISVPLFGDDLFSLAKSGTNAQVAQAVKSGVDVNAADASGMTPMMYAAQYNKDVAVIMTLVQAGGLVDDKALALASKNPNKFVLLVCQQMYPLQAQARKKRDDELKRSATQQANQTAQATKLKPPVWLYGDWATRDDQSSPSAQTVTVSRDDLQCRRNGSGTVNLLNDFVVDASKPPVVTENVTDISYTISGATRTGTEKITFTKVDAGHMSYSVAQGQETPTPVTFVNLQVLENARMKFSLNAPDWLRGNWGPAANGAPVDRVSVDSYDIRLPDESAIAVFIDDPLATLQLTSSPSGFTVSGTIRGKPASWTFTKINDTSIKFEKSEDGKATLSGNYTRIIQYDDGK